MSFEEEFDNIIRRKAEEEHYPFDQNNWDKASGLLDAERKAASLLKLKRFYLPAVLLVILGSAGFVTYSVLDAKQPENELALVTAPAVPSEMITQKPIETIQSNPETPLNENINTHSNTSASSAVTALEIVNSFKKHTVGGKNVNTPFEKKSASIHEENSIAATGADPGLSNAANNGDSGSKQDPSPVNGSSVPPLSNNPVVYQPGSSEILQVQQNPSDKKVTESTDRTVVLSDESVSTSAEEIISTEQLAIVYVNLPFEISDKEIASAPFMYLKRYDDDYYKNTNTPKKQYLNVEAGGNYLLGWNAKKGKDGQGLNWFAGFNYGRYVCPKTSISLGIQMYNISNIKQPFYLISTKEYGFGSKNIYTRVSSNQLYYVAIPLKLNYSINSSNVIGLGFNAAYLVNAENTIEKYYLLDNEEKSISSSTSYNKGIYKGTRMTNLMLSAHYKTQIGNRIGLNLEFNYGLTDLFNNTDLVKTEEKPMGARVSLTYTLFDK